MENFDVAVVGLGALGSAATYQLARRGSSVVAFEQFELGHDRGASHDSSRIVRTSYGAERYVRLAQSAYLDWAELEAVSGETLLTITGGVIFLPSDGPYSPVDFTTSLDAAGVPYEVLTPEEVTSRWPQFRLPANVVTIYTADTGIAHAARTVATLHAQALAYGAHLRANSPVLRLTPDDTGVIVHTASGDVHARRVIVAADAWTNELLRPLGVEIPLVTMQEQVSYFAPAKPADFDPQRFPVWIWEDTLCFYGFPSYGEPTVKAGRDVSENLMTPAERTFEHSPELLAQLEAFMGETMPESGVSTRTVTCQYSLTPNREFVISPLDEHPEIIVALAAGHGFKFTPAIGRILAELALDGETSDDISAFGVPTSPGGLLMHAGGAAA